MNLLQLQSFRQLFDRLRVNDREILQTDQAPLPVTTEETFTKRITDKIYLRKDKGYFGITCNIPGFTFGCLPILRIEDILRFLRSHGKKSAYLKDSDRKEVLTAVKIIESYA